MITSEQLKPFFEATGEMCNEWAHLEQWINRLFMSVGGWDYRIPTAILMSSHIDIRQQIEAIKIGAIQRCPHGSFLDKTMGCLNYIDNELRRTRNEFVHHIWSSSADGIGAVKVDIIPRSKKQRGTGIRQIQHWENRYLTIGEAHEVISDIKNEREYITKILECFQRPEETELPEQLPEPPPRPHLLRLRERQRQRDTET